MKSSKIIAVLIALAALGWIVSGVFLSSSTDENETHKTMPGQSDEGTQKTEKALQRVRVRESTAILYGDELEITGRSQASRQVQMKAEIAGEISEVLKEEGENVTEGDALAELDVRDREVRASEARQRVEQREIEYNAAKQLAERGFNSKVRLAQTRADLEAARAALKQASIDVEKTGITAPFDGVIFRQNVDSGDYLNVGDNLFTIVDLDPIEFVAFVSERNVQALEPGQSASAEFLGGVEIEGTLTYIAPAADPETRTFRVILSAPNEDLRIKDGLTTQIRIPLADKKAHRISPAILTLDSEGRIGVKTVGPEGIVQFYPVEILSDTPEAMWIGGLPDSVRLITVGAEYVLEGQRVEPVPASGDGLL